MYCINNDLKFTFAYMFSEISDLPHIELLKLKEKGDIQDCGNYRGIKLMSHTIKIWERIIDRRLREETTIGDDALVSCHAGRGTTDAIFAVRQLMEKHREKQKGLHIWYL